MYLMGGPSDILTNKIRPSCFYQMSIGQDSFFIQDFSKQTGHSGLGRSGIAGEHHMHCRTVQFDSSGLQQLLLTVAGKGLIQKSLRL